MLLNVPFSTQVALAVIPRWQTEGMTLENLHFLRDTVLSEDPEHPALRDAVLKATERHEGVQAATALAREMVGAGGQDPWTKVMKQLLEPDEFAREAISLDFVQGSLERHYQQILPPLECPLQGLYHLGAFDDAFHHLAALRPTRDDYLWAGLCALEAENFKQAEGWLNTAARGRSPRALLALSELYWKIERPDALQGLLQALRALPAQNLKPLEASLLHELGAHTLSRQGQIGEALLEAERAWASLATQPDCPLYATRLHATLASVQLKQGQPKAAMTTLEAAMAYPASARFRGLKRQILQAFTQLGRPVAAARVLEELTLLIGPARAGGEHALDRAQLLLAQAQVDLAQSALEEALAANPPLLGGDYSRAELSLVGILMTRSPRAALEKLEMCESRLHTGDELLRLQIDWRKCAARLELGMLFPSEVCETLARSAQDFFARQLCAEGATALLWAAHAALKFSSARAFELLSQLSWRILEGDVQTEALTEQWSLLPELHDFARFQRLFERQGGQTLELSSLSPSGLSVDGAGIMLDIEALELVSFLSAHGPSNQGELGAALFPAQDATTLNQTLKRLTEHLQQNTRALSLSGSAKTPWTLEIHGVLHWDVDDIRNRLVARQGRNLAFLSQNPWTAALERDLQFYP